MSRLAGPKALVNGRDCGGLPWRPTWGQLSPPQPVTVVQKCEPRDLRTNFSRETGLWHTIFPVYMLATNSICFIFKTECKIDQVTHIFRMHKAPWLPVCSKLSGPQTKHLKESDKGGIHFSSDITNCPTQQLKRYGHGFHSF